MSTRQTQMWSKPRRILLATGLTDLKFTLPVAIQQALAYKAELRIAHVLPDASASGADPISEGHSESDRVRKEAEKQLEAAVAQATAAGVRCSSHLAFGNVVNELIELSTRWKAERLIAGSHGKAKLHPHVLGSSAEALFHRIEIPVLAVGYKAASKVVSAKERMRIVLASSLERDAQRIAKFALSVAESHHADIWLVHVISNAVQEHPTAATIDACARNMLQDILKLQPIQQCRPTCDVVYGQPVESILAYAARRSADMIILGASAHSAFDARFIPGKAYRVLCESPCPVLVLKQESAWIQGAAVATVGI